MSAYTQLTRTSLRLNHAITYANLAGSLKHLLTLICFHHNDELGYAWPGIKRLAALAGTSERTVRRNLDALQDKGVLVIEHKGHMKHYFIQEMALLDMPIGDMQLSAEHPKTWTPVSNNVTNKTPNLDKNDSFFGHQCPHNGGRERKIGTEKGNGGGTDACAMPPAPATPAAPEPAPSPALFASHLGQPEQPTAGLAKEDRSAEQHAIAQVNAQRVTNGKKPFTLADQRQLAAEAAKANISTLQAVEWILERSSRNFFRADFFVPPVQQPALQAATAPAMPKAAPVPVVLSPEEQAKLEAQAAAAKAKAMALVASWNGTKKSQKDEATTVPKHLTGPAWAVDAVGRYRAGERVGLYALESACSVLKINLKALRAECAKVPVTT